MQIDDTDRRLMDLLRDDARMPVTALAQRLKLARTTVQARLSRLEEGGAIAGYTLKRGAGLGPMLRATVLVVIEPRRGPAVLDRLKILPGIERAVTTSGRFDLLVQVSAATPGALDELLDRIGEAPGVRSSESLIHLSTKIDRD
ncbi:Lrp/AsnC family transcriptional regulator [Chachezhania sediminis]|uniref:Lrp/AsnC family transcriptional regulator n=1 Tax=Chachezhania sediminis TaxID=2599291 RepID=UPI00131D896B|nr:Lrp/AsnC family transcriptional regulator [Chachezhania sediminis]